MIQTAIDATTVVATPPNQMREAGYKLRLLVEKMLKRPNNYPFINAAVATCMMADLIDAELSGPAAHWGYSSDTARVMIERLKEAGGPPFLVQAYEDLGYGKITLPAKEFALGVATILRTAIFALSLKKTSTLLSQEESEQLILVIDVIRALNEHRKLRTGRGFVEDDLLTLL